MDRARRPRRAAVAVLASIVAAWPAGARAYRPVDGTDAAVAEPHDVEVELQPAGYLSEGGQEALVAPALVVNWGFADGWEAVAEGRHLVHVGGELPEPAPWIEDAAVSLKHVVRAGSLQDRPGASVAAELSALVPGGHGEDGVGASWTLIVSQRWRDLAVHLNGAAAWTRAHEPGAFASAILEGPDRWPIRPVAEAFVEAQRHELPRRSALAGAIWRASEGLSLDAAVRVARAGTIGTTELRVGLTFAFRVR